MIGINLAKINISLAQLKALRKKVKEDADGIFRQKLYYLGEMAAYISPQFSGDFVSNWHIVVDGNMPIYREGGRDPEIREFVNSQGKRVYRQTPKEAGDLEFVRPTLSRFAAQLRGVTIHSNVHLVNASPLDTDGTNMTGPDGKVALRFENIIPGRVRIEQYLRTHARNMPKVRPGDIA